MSNERRRRGKYARSWKGPTGPERYRFWNENRPAQEAKPRRSIDFPEDAPSDISSVSLAIERMMAVGENLDTRNRQLLAFIEEYGERMRYEDESLMVFNKPPGVVAHASHGTTYGILEVARVVHGREDIYSVNRLDGGTSGLMVLGIGMDATQALRLQFSGRGESAARKEYAAFLEGEFVARPNLRVEVGVARTTHGKMSVVYNERTSPDVIPESEKPTVTTFSGETVMLNPLTGSKVSFVDVLLGTGMTHQIRVVAAEMLGHPVVGDTHYGANKKLQALRPLVHARFLTLTHPVNGGVGTLEAPFPEDFLAFASAHTVIDRTTGGLGINGRDALLGSKQSPLL